MTALTNIYFIRCGEFVKIGRGGDPEQRAKDLQTGNPYEIEVMGSFTGTEAEERRLHAAFQQFHHRAEWFFLSNTVRAFITQHCRKKRPPVEQLRLVPTRTPTVVTDDELLDNIKLFLEQRTEPKPGSKIRAGVVYEAYLSWCEQERLAGASMVKFGHAITALGVEKDHRNNRSHYIGIELRKAA